MARRFKQLKREYCHIHTSEGLIPYALIRSGRRRSMVINIKDNGQVNVYSPRFVKNKDIENFIREKAAWIIRKGDEAKREHRYIKSKKYEHGHKFLFQGRKFGLEVVEENIKRTGIDFDGQKWVIKIPRFLPIHQRQERIKEKLLQWYKIQAREILGTRVFHFSRIMGIEPLDISIRTQKNIWGSCHHDQKKINLNWQLVMSPMAVIDYVIVHEMCHLFVPDHSKRFWRRVSKILPDYPKRQRWLRDHSMDLKLPS